MKAKYPLARGARSQVKEIPGKPGSYNAVAYLRPWLQFEELTASLRMVARIPTDGRVIADVGDASPRSASAGVSPMRDAPRTQRRRLDSARTRPMNPRDASDPDDVYARARTPAAHRRLPSLLDAVLDATGDAPPSAPRRSRPAGSTRSSASATSRRPSALARRRPGRWHGDLKRQLAPRSNRDVARIDELLNAQVNAILHHPAFQKLEAVLARAAATSSTRCPRARTSRSACCNVDAGRSWSATWSGRSSSTRASCSARSTATSSARPAASRSACSSATTRCATGRARTTRPTTWRRCAASPASRPRRSPRSSPAIDPRFLELDSFAELERPLDLARTFEQLDYLKWRAFREHEDARFVGLALPRVLYRAAVRRRRRPARTASASARTRRPRTAAATCGATPCFALRRRARSGRSPRRLAGRHPRRAAGRGQRRAGDRAAGASATAPAAAETPRSVDRRAPDRRPREGAGATSGFIPLCHCRARPRRRSTATPSVQKPKEFDDAGGDGERPAVGDAAVHPVRVAVRPLPEGDHPRPGRRRSRPPADVEDELAKWLASYVGRATTTPARR